MTTTSASATPQSRALYVVLKLGISAYLLFHLAIALFDNLNPDETQFLLNGWNISQGQRLYLDFWDNHGPLLNYLLGIVFAYAPQDHAVVYFIRLLFWMNTCLLAWLTWKLVRENLPGEHLLALASVLVLLAAPTFITKSHEIRGDNPLNTLWIVGLLLLMRALRRNNLRGSVAAGLVICAIFGFSIKLTYIGIAAALAVVGWALVQKRNPLPHLLALASGAVFSIAVAVAVIFASNLWLEFLKHCIVNNLSRDYSFSADYLRKVTRVFPVWSALYIAGLLYAVARLWRVRKTDAINSDERTALMQFVLIAAFLWAFFFFVMPTQYLQSLLPAQVPIAILTAMLLVKIYGTVSMKYPGNNLPAFGAGMLVSVALLVQATDELYIDRELPRRLSRADAMLKLTAPDDYIFDGIGLPLFRRRPHYHQSLVSALRRLHAKERVNLRIVEGLRKHKPTLVLLNHRTSTLREIDMWHLQEYYEPSTQLQSIPGEIVLVPKADKNTSGTQGFNQATVEKVREGIRKSMPRSSRAMRGLLLGGV